MYITSLFVYLAYLFVSYVEHVNINSLKDGRNRATFVLNFCCFFLSKEKEKFGTKVNIFIPLSKELRVYFL